MQTCKRDIVKVSAISDTDPNFEAILVKQWDGKSFFGNASRVFPLVCFCHCFFQLVKAVILDDFAAHPLTCYFVDLRFTRRWCLWVQSKGHGILQSMSCLSQAKRRRFTHGFCWFGIGTGYRGYRGPQMAAPSNQPYIIIHHGNLRGSPQGHLPKK